MGRTVPCHLKSYCWLSFAIAFFLGNIQPVSSMMTVWNPSSFQQMAQMITNATRTINEMQAIKSQMQQMKQLIGNPSSLRQALNLGFLDQKTDAVGLLNQINLFTSQMPDPTNIEAIRAHAESRLFLPTPNNLTASLQQTIRAERQHVLQEASLNSFALAEQQKHSIPKSTQQIQSIAQQSVSANTVIEAVRHTNQLLTLVIAELRELRILQAQHLELHTAFIADTLPVAFRNSGLAKP